jgi:hypothetical protein
MNSALIPEGSPALRAAFAGLALLTAALFVTGVYWSSVRTNLPRPIATRHAMIAAVASAVWLALTGVAAARGVLTFDGRPPTMIILLFVLVAITVGFSMSAAGRRVASGIPLAALVGFHGFRVLVELAMHRAYTEGLMPVQMSYSGRNFDIVSGLTALALGLWLATGERRAWRPVVIAWNVLGSLLLLNIVAIALLSAPTPFRVFMNEPANVWITGAPYIWLPAVLVLAAMLGHVLVYRRLRAT